MCDTPNARMERLNPRSSRAPTDSPTATRRQGHLQSERCPQQPRLSLRDLTARAQDTRVCGLGLQWCSSGHRCRHHRTEYLCRRGRKCESMRLVQSGIRAAREVPRPDCQRKLDQLQETDRAARSAQASVRLCLSRLRWGRSHDRPPPARVRRPANGSVYGTCRGAGIVGGGFAMLPGLDHRGHRSRVSERPMRRSHHCDMVSAPDN